MSKLLLSITIVGFVFAGSWDNASTSVIKYDQVKDQYCLVENTSDDDSKLEAGRRRGKGNKGRRRGGGGLR